MTASHIDLAQLVRGDEGQYFDRKSLFQGPAGAKVSRDRRDVRDDVARYVAAFANADGGTLVLGVEDDGTVTGHQLPQDAVDDLLAVPVRRLNPPQRPGERAVLDGQEVFVFDIDAAPAAVMVIGDGFPYRVGDSVIQFAETAINAIKKRGQLQSFEAQPCEATLDALDAGLVHAAARAAAMPDASAEEYLRRRGLADLRGSRLVLRQGALLLFGRNAESIDHPGAAVRIFRVSGTERLHGDRHNVEARPRIEGNLPTLIQDAYRELNSLVRRSAQLHDLFFRETPEYPVFAWQEAIVNAIAHRDYGLAGNSVEVWLYDDRMEVVSPGDLLDEVMLEDLRGRHGTHASRNPRITRCLADLGFMREQGEGIPRMFEEMEASYLPLPELESRRTEFKVTLRNTLVLEGVDPDWARAVRLLPWRISQKRALVGFLGRGFSNEDYRRLNGMDRDQAYREIKELVEAGLLAPEGLQRGTTYRVLRGAAPPAVVESMQSDLSAEKWANDAVRTAGGVTNVELRRATGLDRTAAKRLLHDWQEQGYIELEGQGRGARWVAGPMLEQWSRLVKKGP